MGKSVAEQLVDRNGIMHKSGRVADIPHLSRIPADVSRTRCRALEGDAVTVMITVFRPGDREP